MDCFSSRCGQKNSFKCDKLRQSREFDHPLHVSELDGCATSASLQTSVCRLLAHCFSESDPKPGPLLYSIDCNNNRKSGQLSSLKAPFEKLSSTLSDSGTVFGFGCHCSLLLDVLCGRSGTAPCREPGQCHINVTCHVNCQTLPPPRLPSVHPVSKNFP